MGVGLYSGELSCTNKYNNADSFIFFVYTKIYVLYIYIDETYYQRGSRCDSRTRRRYDIDVVYTARWE